MYYIDITNQISFLIVMCSSLLVFYTSSFLEREKSHTSLMGKAFIIPAVMSVLSFLSTKEALSGALLTTGDIGLLAVLLLLLSEKEDTLSYKAAMSVVYAIAVLLPLLVILVKPFPFFIDIPKIGFIIFAILTAAAVYLFVKRKEFYTLLFPSIFALLVSNMVKLLDFISAFSYISLLLKLSAFCAFFAYFYVCSNNKYLSRINEYEKKLSVLSRSVELEVRKRTMDIERVNQNLLNISRTDALTKTLNKTALLDTIDALINDSKRGTFSIIMFDIDDFKVINDTQGHVAGDKCIRKLSFIAKDSIRSCDSLGRYGGDEFIIILPGATTIQAKIIAERFRQNVEKNEVPKFTISSGIATFPNDADTVQDLVAFADEGLYISKAKGKNRVSHKNLY